VAAAQSRSRARLRLRKALHTLSVLANLGLKSI
jgi:hypothetical protein